MDEFKPVAIKPAISVTDVEKLDVRVGTIVAVSDIPKSEKPSSSRWTSATSGGRFSLA